MKEEIEKLIKKVLQNLDIPARPHESSGAGGDEVDFSVEHPDDMEHGDYSTNVAMVAYRSLAVATDSHVPGGKKNGIVWVGKSNNPKGLAEKIKNELEKNLPKEIERVEEKNGFINFYLFREFFTESVEDILEKGDNWGRNEILSGKKVMVEYTDPNPFKPFHIGHLMTNAIGESLSRIVEFSGAKTIRANYQGDVGLHIAKAIYVLNKKGMPDKSKSISEQAQYIGECYSEGNNLYDTDQNSKEEIDRINIIVYKKSNQRGDESIYNTYIEGMEITMRAFEEIYEILGTKFNKNCYYLESIAAPIGEKIVRENLGKVFEESNGAIVFHAENYDPKLHTRVFINSQGLPTYETKEIGLTITKFENENLDTSIVITATEQAEYMKVVEKAISLIHPDYEKKMLHITHGMMRFADGKMSSRKGNVVTGESLLRDVQEKVLEKMRTSNFNDKPFVIDPNVESEKRYEKLEKIANQVGVSALKYSILRSSLGSDIVYDFEKSISFEGDSGPYLQYTAVRANSILEKAKDFELETRNEIPREITDLEKLLYQFPEIVEHSYAKLEPHHIATYLTELASAFNNFYGNTKILVAENKNMVYQLNLVKAFYQTMENGLWLLGIEVPERM